MCRFTLIFLASLAELAAGQETNCRPSDLEGYEYMHNPVAGFVIHWAHPTTEISFLVEAVAEEWTAVGFSNDGEMIGSDAVIFLPDQDDVSEHLLGSKSVTDIVSVDGDLDALLETSSSQSGGTTVFSFTRVTAPDDPSKLTVPNLPGIPIYLIWAKGMDNGFGYHGQDNRGSFMVDLFCPSAGGDAPGRAPPVPAQPAPGPTPPTMAPPALATPAPSPTASGTTATPPPAMVTSAPNAAAAGGAATMAPVPVVDAIAPSRAPFARDPLPTRAPTQATPPPSETPAITMPPGGFRLPETEAPISNTLDFGGGGTPAPTAGSRAVGDLGETPVPSRSLDGIVAEGNAAQKFAGGVSAVGAAAVASAVAAVFAGFLWSRNL